MLLNGAPPPDHPRRCHGKIRRKHKRCGKWALKGRNYCQFCGGRSGRYSRVIKLPRFYAKELTGTLQEYVEASLGAAPHEQLNLFEELAIMRAAAAETVALFAAAQQSKDSDTRAAAAMLMQEALKHVVATCESAARIEAGSKDKISIHNIAHVVQQIVRIAYAVFGDEAEVKSFERQIRENVKIAGDKSGTDLTPDVDVGEMDETVPCS